MRRPNRRPDPQQRRSSKSGDSRVWAAPIAVPTPPARFHVKSFGCQMNVYDGERMAELLAAQGMTAVDEREAAILSCSTPAIREKATEKVYSDIGRLRREDGSIR
jgi:tRNA-2-methylthio-N6-dimethylallyladenosine synthase